MEVTQNILKKSVTEAEKYRSVEINKLVDTDVGALLVCDPHPIDPKSFKLSSEEYLKRITRENAQILFAEIYKLPTERIEEAIVVKLPKSKYKLPRSKPVPRQRPLTKWEEFAKAKGIQKKKKTKLTWDDQLNTWVPRFGFKRSAAQKDKDWLLEVPQNADPMEDQFAKKIDAKSEKVAKNELQRMRNIAKAKNVKVPRFGLTNPDVSSAKELQAAVTVARSSTASLGKFQQKLPKEKEAKGVAAITPGASRKRKLPPVSGSEEKDHNLKIMEGVLNKRPKIDMQKAVARHINEEQIQRSEEKRGEPKRQRRNHIGSGGSSKGGKKKPKNVNRPRKGKIAGGRKRR